jgi:imidazole glycerol-phosphate synthase subunit HisH
MITIVDYGMGNLRSVQKALEFVGATVMVSSDPKDILRADKVILPGVGAFGQAMQNLKQKNLIVPLKQAMQEKPFLGICLGMQLLISVSAEFGPVPGLAVVPGSVDYFREAPGFDQSLSVPHMGWNTVQQQGTHPLFRGLPQSFYVYFVHSFFVNPIDAAVIIGETRYGLDFCAALAKGNIWGIQFHPEKSSEVGLAILKNFAQA